MIKLKSLLQLNEFDFKPARDQKPYDREQTISFDPNDKAVIDKNLLSHDLASHAIKHLEEFDPSLISSLLIKFKDYIKNLEYKQIHVLSPNGFEQDINDKLLKPGFNKKGIELYLNRLLDKEVLLNTLDRINDKVVKKEELTEEENYLLHLIKTLTDNYSKLLENNLNKSIDINNLPLDAIKNVWKSGKTIRFNAVSPEGRWEILYINPNDKGMVVTDSVNTVLTFYKINRKFDSSAKDIKYHVLQKFSKLTTNVKNFFEAL